MPASDQQPEPTSFEVEITDLDALQRAESSLRGRLSSLFLRWQRPEHRRARLWLSGVLLIVLMLTLIEVVFNPVAAVTALLQAQRSLPPAPVPLSTNNVSSGPSFFSRSNDILCPVQTAWSPNSSFIAILGYTQLCAENEYVPAQIDVYNASTARQVAHWQPDVAILKALQKLPGVSVRLRAWASRKPGFGAPEASILVPSIQYLQMLWSPDSTRVAISFGASARFITYEGLFLAGIDGSHARVLLHPETQQAGSSQFAPLQWDLQRDSAVPLNSLAPALTYTWDERDTLVPLSPLDAQGPPSAYAALPPGNPSGGRTFSVWQPGRPSVLLILRAPGAYLWSSNFAAWSPDSRYLITDIVFAGLMEPPGHAFPTPETLSMIAAEGMPFMPDHDAALIPASTGAQTAAWNPAGTLLAVYNLAGTVNLYDCNTGRLLRSFQPSQMHPLDGAATLLSWSPDGRSLLLSSAQAGLITLWKAGALRNFLT